ncbi:MAG TPA: DnaJ domain-containing protein [Myxococcota bacterium]|nr:DnaJ domain-containing protein [Myxococcota bacterium]
MKSLPASGKLSETPLPVLLLELSSAHFTGALSLSRNRTTKRVLWRDGAPILAESNLASETLGVTLLDSGKLSREDYSKVVGYVQLKNCKEGKALLDLKLLEPKGLFLALKEQLRRRILECFGWPDGAWSLDPKQVPPPDAQAFRLDPRVLAQDGIESHWGPERVLGSLGERLGRTVRARESRELLAGRLRAAPGVAKLLDALDGTCTLGEALRRAGAPGALSAAWVLDASGLLTYPDSEEQGADDSPRGAVTTGLEDPAFDIEVLVSGAAAPSPAPPASAKATARRGPTEARAAGQESADAAALRREVTEKHTRVDLDHYALLGIPREATPADIKRAYFSAAKRLHPDALSRTGLEALRKPANELFARIAKAYAVLSDPKARRDYDADATGGEEGEAERIAQAETLYRKGEILVRKGAFQEAIQFLGPAVELWAEDAEYRSALGWALYKKGKSEPQTAREHLSKAVQLDRKNAVAHYRLGVVLRALGEQEAAQKALALAKQLDPKGKAG